MLSQEWIGRLVRVIAWYDHAPLIAARRGPRVPRDGPQGTVTRVDATTGQVAVRVEGVGRVFLLPWGDVEVLPPVGVVCPVCAGTGRSGGRPCPFCEGGGELDAAVAWDGADIEEMEAGPTDEG